MKENLSSFIVNIPRKIEKNIFSFLLFAFLLSAILGVIVYYNSVILLENRLKQENYSNSGLDKKNYDELKENWKNQEQGLLVEGSEASRNPFSNYPFSNY